jgi:hypothetical protein
MTPAAFRALCGRVWARQAPSSRWLALEGKGEGPPPAPGHPAPGAGSTKCTDALASEGQDTRMPHAPQEEPLDIGANLGWCHGCGKRRVLCQFGQCVVCHYDSARGPKQDPQEAAGELCCGWYATGKLDGPWTCPTCQRFYPA